MDSKVFEMKKCVNKQAKEDESLIKGGSATNVLHCLLYIQTEHKPRERKIVFSL